MNQPGRRHRTWPVLLPRAAALLLLGLLCACAQRYPAGLDVDTSIQSVSQDSRVRFIVLHYTVSGDDGSLRTLTQGDVSSHYLVSKAGPDGHVVVHRLVPEDRNAWHAGDSSWYGYTHLNNSSIGIEIVNPGPVAGTDGRQQWADYSDEQIRVVMLLVADIARRHGVQPENIVGHSDIAPQRKTDPGPRFPWRRLAQAGIGRWYDETAAARWRTQYEQQGTPDVAWFQEQLERVGYEVPHTGELDRATVRVIAAFQMHYRPSDFSGQPDPESASILQVLSLQQQ
jgi:N-acetylmuramoyl-L-alanine amidase